MLVDELNSALREYKSDTNYIVIWLATTAKAHGCKLEDSDPPKAPGRPKGKARKQAKQASKQSTNRKYVIAVRQFVPLAEYISNYQPDISVPESLAASLRRAIKSRGEFGGRLQQYGYDLDALADDSHKHFVGVLARVCNVLRPRMAFEQKPTDKGESSRDSTGDFSNYFSRLSIKEPDEVHVDDHSKILTSDLSDMSSGRIQYVAEQQTTREDALFALHKVIEDVSEIRKHITAAWDQVFIQSTEYTYYPITSAVLLTSLGLELAKDLFEEITEICEQHGGIRQLLEVLCAATADASGLSKEQIWEQPDEGGHFNTDHIPISWDVDTSQVFPLEYECSNREKEIADVMLLHWYFTESTSYAPSWKMMAQDEPMKTLESIHKLASEPAHVALAGQIFIDLHHRHGENITKAFDIMIQQMGHIQDELRCYKTFKDAHHGSKQPLHKSKRRNLENLSTFLDVVVSENLVPCKKREFLRRNPMLCGLTLFFFQSELEEYSVDILNSDPTIIASAHLYNAVWKEQLLSESWPDLDVLMTVLPKSSFFVGEDRPSGLRKYQQRYLLQLGIPASAFAPNCKRLNNIQGTARQRQIKRRNEFMHQLSAKYKPKENTASSHWTKEFVESFLDMTTHQEVFSEFKESSGNLESHQLMMTSDQIRTRNRGLKSNTRARLSVSDLMMSLRKSLLAETPCFVFPYLTILQTAWECLEKVRIACEPQLERSYIGYCCDAKRQDHFISCLFGAAVKGISSSGSTVDLLKEAAAAVREFIGLGLVNEALYRLYEGMGLAFTECDGFMVCSYHEPPRPSEDVVARLREWTQVKELFDEANGKYDSTSTEDDENVKGSDV